MNLPTCFISVAASAALCSGVAAAQEEPPDLFAPTGILSGGQASFSPESGDTKLQVLRDAAEEALEVIQDSLPEGPERLRAEILRSTPVGFPTLLKTDGLSDRGEVFEGIEPKADAPQRLVRFERVIDDANFLPASFLVTGSRTLRPVGRVALNYGPRGSARIGVGTGFLVAPGWILTNSHVIANEREARAMVFQLDFQYDETGLLGDIREYSFDTGERNGVPGLFTSPADQFDFALIRLRLEGGEPPGATHGVIALPTESDQGILPFGLRVNVIQHPQGRPKEIAIHDNRFVKRSAHFLRYTADTDPGSSGSPVFDDFWNLVALHHSAGDWDRQLGVYVNNEGVRIDAIVDAMRDPNVEPVLPESLLAALGLSAED